MSELRAHGMPVLLSDGVRPPMGGAPARSGSCHQCGGAAVGQVQLAIGWRAVCAKHRPAPAPRQVTLSQPAPVAAGAPPVGLVPLPPVGAADDVRGAREFLSKHHPAWAQMTNDERQTAAVALRELQRHPNRVQLSQRRSVKPLLLLCVFAGATPRARAKAFLAAVSKEFAALPFDIQAERARALWNTHDVIDIDQEQ